MEIYFDGTLIDSDNYISFTNEFKQFDKSFMLGTAASNTITIEVPGNIAIPTNVLIKINDSNYSTMIVDSYEYEDNNILKLNLVDKMVLLDFNYNAQPIVPCTVKQILQDICTKAGITLATTTFTNQNLSVDYYDNTITAREYVSMIAELNGGFARINIDGALELVKFTGTPTNIDIDTCEDFRVGEKHKIERVVFDNGLLKFETSSDETKETLYLNNQNVYINDETTFNNIASQILNFEFYCFSTGNCEIKSNVRAGDLINFTDGTNNYPTIAQYNLNYVGGLNGGYELNINSQRQEETKIVGLGEQYKRLSVKIDRDKNEILEIVESQISDVEKEINPTSTASGSSIYLEDSAKTELIDFELEGKTEQDGEPTPDNPSELVSVGYKNYFTLDYITAAGITKNDTETNDFTYTDCWGRDIVLNTNLIKMLEPSTSYTITYKYQILERPSTFGRWNVNYNLLLYNGSSSVSLGTTNKNTIELNKWETTTAAFTTPSNLTDYRILAYNFKDGDNTTTGAIRIKDLMITKIQQAHSYIPYGKYGIEVKTRNANLFDINKNYYYGANTTSTVSDNTLTINGKWFAYQLYDLKPNTNYVLTLKKEIIQNAPNTGLIRIFGGTNSNNIINQVNSNVVRFNTGEYNQVGILFFASSNGTDTGIIKLSEIMLNEGTISLDYRTGQANAYLYTLDNPLCSIGDTKDLLYIKNGMLYVDRKIGKVVLDGSEDWENWSPALNYGFRLRNINNLKNIVSSSKEKILLCDYFKIAESQDYLTSNNTIEGMASTVGNLYVRLNQSSGDIKTWLSTHNTKVQYVLDTPYTEEIGQVDIPSTYKGITYLNTTDELEPNMNITYVRDTVIANYVESHVSELKITEKSIESRVQTIEESDYGGRINAVEERTTDTEKNIEVISTNIDTTTGEVRKVTTTNGMTFDENGLNIHTNQSTFNAQHTYEGTYYRDGDEVITETTINGFKATNLKNKGQHEYSYDDTHDLYEFIDERIEVDGEYCYATFYNGEE